MSDLKRKSTVFAPGSTTKPAKKRELSSAPTKPTLSEEFVRNSSDDETARTSVKAKKTAVKSAEEPAGSNVSKRAREKAFRETERFAENLMSLPQDERNYAELISISSMSGSSASEDSDSKEEEESPARSGSDADQANARDEGTESPTTSGISERSKSGSEPEREESEAPPKPVRIASSSASQEQRPPYDPPTGFTAATIKASSNIKDLFAKENLEGKQIWHIKVPASVPINSIKEIPIQKVVSGESILSYKDADYGLVTEADVDGDEKVLLIPSTGKFSYETASAKIARTLNLQQIVKLPSLSDRPTNAGNPAARVPKTHVKNIRQQPEGLRMRYRPFGDESSPEGSDTAPKFKVPPVLTPISSSQKNRSSERGDSTSPAKEKSKHNPSTKPMHNSNLATEDQRDDRVPVEPAHEKAMRRADKKRRREGKEQRRSSAPKNLGGEEVAEDRKMLQATEERHEPNILSPGQSRSEISRKQLRDRLSNGPFKAWDEAMAQKRNEASATASNAVDDSHQERAEKEKVKTKRKKRKSEATEEEV